MTYYVTIAERLDRGHAQANATIRQEAAFAASGREVPATGSLGTTTSSGQTWARAALGGFPTVAAARKAARASIRNRGFRPRRMEEVMDYEAGEVFAYAIEGRP
jgi:hypothetical protein